MLKFTIDLDNIAHNYNVLKKMHGDKVAAVLKANAYGVGAAEVAKKLYFCGCKYFFSVGINESIKLKNVLNKISKSNNECTVIDLLGPLRNQEGIYLEKNIIPCINSIEQINRWVGFSKNNKNNLKIYIMLDSGINRTGILLQEKDELLKIIIKEKLNVNFYLTHLASAWDENCKTNYSQLEKFNIFCGQLPKAKKSISATDGVFLGEKFRSSMARVGIGLYGFTGSNKKNNFKDTVKLSAPILQIKNIKKGEKVGYDLTWAAKKNTKVATLFGGYGDGIQRIISNKATLYYKKIAIPQIGRLSMDTILVDISNIENISPGDYIDIFNSNKSILDLCKISNTIPYEILINLVGRIKFNYKGKV